VRPSCAEQTDRLEHGEAAGGAVAESTLVIFRFGATMELGRSGRRPRRQLCRYRGASEHSTDSVDRSLPALQTSIYCLTNRFSPIPPKSNISWRHHDIRFEPQPGAALICTMTQGRASRDVRNCDGSFRIEKTQNALCGWATYRNEFRFSLY